MLKNDHLEEWIDKINEKKGNIQLFFDSKKAKHAHKLETMELYIQHAIEQVRKMSISMPNILDNFKPSGNFIANIT